MWRYHPQTEALVRLARGDRAAARRARRVRLPAPGDDTGNVRLQADLEGGALMDVGCYCVSALRLLCGEPERVRAASSVERAASTAASPACCGSRATCSACSTAGFDVPPRGGDRGRRRGRHAGRRGPLARRLAPRLTRDGEEVPVEAANPYRLELEDLSAAIRAGREPRLGRADAVGQARAIEMLYAAAEPR